MKKLLIFALFLIMPFMVYAQPGAGGYKKVIRVDSSNTAIENKISTLNSTITTLDPAEVWEGTEENVTNYACIYVTVTSDVASAIDGLKTMVRSALGTWRDADEYTIASGADKTFSVQPNITFFKAEYANGGTIQGLFDIETKFVTTGCVESSHRIQDSIVDEDDASLVKNVNTGQSDITGFFENIISYRGALQVDNALVHRVGISEHAKIDLDGSTTLDVAASAGDTLINVTATTNFAAGSLLTINGTTAERSHFHVLTVNAGVSLELNRPLDNDHDIGATIQEVDIGINANGSLGSPVSYKIQPPSNERWQITRIMTTMLDDAAMDDGTFGGLTALTNGVVLKLHVNGVDQTLTHWKSNADLKDDMYDVTYSDRAPAGQYGLSSRWTFTKSEFVADLDGANGDYLEVLIQDNLTGLLDFEVKGQGRLFGG